MSIALKPIFTLLSFDFLDHGYQSISELPDMIETVIDAASLRFVKLGFQFDVQPTVQFTGPDARNIRNQLVSAMAQRLMAILPYEHESQTKREIIVGADMATPMAERLYRRAVHGKRSEVATTGNNHQWRAIVKIKAGVDLIFSPDPKHIALCANDDMASGEATFGLERVYWRLRTCVGDVTNYFDENEFRLMWLENVQKAFPFVQPDSTDFRVHR